MAITHLAFLLQALGLTADNGSNNDTMISTLQGLAPGHLSETNRVRCFAHVLSLVAKSLIRQFEARARGDQAAVEEEERELQELVADFDMDELAAQMQSFASLDASDRTPGVDDDPDDEVDPMADLDDEERERFEREVRPMKLVLAKVSNRVQV